jgi:hypothetical protein
LFDNQTFLKYRICTARSLFALVRTILLHVLAIAATPP